MLPVTMAYWLMMCYLLVPSVSSLGTDNAGFRKACTTTSPAAAIVLVQRSAARAAVPSPLPFKENDENMVLSTNMKTRSSVASEKFSSPISPISWFHVPRTGSSFLYNLVSLGPVCDVAAIAKLGLEPGKNLNAINVDDACPGFSLPGSCKRSNSDVTVCAEETLAREALHRGTHVVGMFRQPEQRLLSDWNFERELQRQQGGKGGEFGEFAQTRQGCAMRLLTGNKGPDYHCRDGPPEFDPKAAMSFAIATLHKFTFVGLTEQWDLSMCLFNAIFGTPCRAEQFWQFESHNTSSNLNGGHDKSVLQGFVDKYDRPVYEAATQIFNKALKRYKVSKQTCKVCLEQAKGQLQESLVSGLDREALHNLLDSKLEALHKSLG